MSKKAELLLKPGTLIIFVFIGILGLGLYLWATSGLNDTRESSLQDQNKAIVCSNIEVSNSGIQNSGNKVTVFFKSNTDLESISLNFEGETNVTKTVESIEANKIHSATANMSDYSEILLKTPDCSRVFRFE